MKGRNFLAPSQQAHAHTHAHNSDGPELTPFIPIQISHTDAHSDHTLGRRWRSENEKEKQKMAENHLTSPVGDEPAEEKDELVEEQRIMSLEVPSSPTATTREAFVRLKKSEAYQWPSLCVCVGGFSIKWDLVPQIHPIRVGVKGGDGRWLRTSRPMRKRVKTSQSCKSWRKWVRSNRC